MIVPAPDLIRHAVNLAIADANGESPQPARNKPTIFLSISSPPFEAMLSSNATELMEMMSSC